MRRGPNGGLLVCEPDAAPATHAVIIYLQYQGTTVGDLLDARLLLEPLAASLAAEQIDEAGIDRLRAVLCAEGPHVEFHEALAKQSKNPVLQLFIDILMRLTVRYAQDSQLDSVSDALEAIEHRYQEHADIVTAVTAGDSARAKTLSERHAQSVTAWLQEHQPVGRARSRGSDREAPNGKLVEVFRRHWSTSGQPSPSRRDLADVQHTHLRIIEAIADGDDSLVRYRTRRHLDAAESWWL